MKQPIRSCFLGVKLTQQENNAIEQISLDMGGHKSSLARSVLRNHLIKTGYIKAKKQNFEKVFPVTRDADGTETGE
jgi:hypothetical protein